MQLRIAKASLTDLEGCRGCRLESLRAPEVGSAYDGSGFSVTTASSGAARHSGSASLAIANETFAKEPNHARVEVAVKGRSVEAARTGAKARQVRRELGRARRQNDGIVSNFSAHRRRSRRLPQMICPRAVRILRRLCGRRAEKSAARGRRFTQTFQCDLGSPVPPQKFSAFAVGRLGTISSPRPFPARGADRASSRTRERMRWTRQRRRADVFAGRFSVSEQRRETNDASAFAKASADLHLSPAKPLGEDGCCVRQNRVVLASVADAKSRGDASAQPG